MKDKEIKEATRVIIGAGDRIVDGWVSTEIRDLDIRVRRDFENYWKPETLDAILAEHVFEHLTLEDCKVALNNCYDYLKPGGYIRLAVPDGYHVDKEYIENVRPGGKGIGSEYHKFLYNYKSLSELLSNADFNVKLLEYWDERGEFHYREWDVADGYIYRSKDHDKRNKESPLSYTSLIVDAIK